MILDQGDARPQDGIGRTSSRNPILPAGALRVCVCVFVNIVQSFVSSCLLLVLVTR